jgi:hypothetical protein
MKMRMKMKKFTYLLAIMLVGVMGTAGIAAAFGGFWGAGFINSEQRTAIKQAIENNDYNAWKDAIIATLTQENFNKLVERYKVISERRELQNAVKQAIKEGNYTAYREAMEKLIGTYKVMSEEEFNALVERYNAGAGFRCFKRGFCICRFHVPW